MEIRGDGAVPEHLHRLDQARDAGGGLEVANVRLHGADVAGPVGRPAAAERVDQCLHLDRVAEGGPGSMRLHVADLQALKPGGP